MRGYIDVTLYLRTSRRLAKLPNYIYTIFINGIQLIMYAIWLLRLLTLLRLSKISLWNPISITAA